MSEDDLPERRESSEDFRSAFSAMSADIKGQVNEVMRVHQDRADAGFEKMDKAFSSIHDSQITMAGDIRHISTEVDRLRDVQEKQGRRIAQHASDIQSSKNQNADQYTKLESVSSDLARVPGMIAEASVSAAKGASLEAIKKDLGETDILKTIQGSAPLQMAVAIVIVVVVLGIFQILGHDPSESAGKLIHNQGAEASK
jgi:hypothetical protein